MIYFARVIGRPEIKIGWAIDVRARMQCLQNAHVDRVEIVRVLRAPKSAERELHARFDEQWLSGEWFAPHSDMFSDLGFADVEPPVALPPRSSRLKHSAEVIALRLASRAASPHVQATYEHRRKRAAA